MKLRNFVSPNNKPRKIWITVILSLLFPGLGQMYNGQFIKGICHYLSFYVVATIFGSLRFPAYFEGLITLFFSLSVIRIYSLIDAIKNAIKLKEFEPKFYNKWYYYLLTIGFMYFISFLVEFSVFTGIQVVNVPGYANEPTILQGDYLAIDKRAYENTKPEYGDFVCFETLNKQKFIYRVIAKPGDHLEVQTDKIRVNGKDLIHRTIRKSLFLGQKVEVKKETLFNNKKHFYYQLKSINTVANQNLPTEIKIKVTKDSYYLMGDNRDFAADSRYLGLINEGQIIGKVVYVLVGRNFKRINIDLR